MVRSAWPLSPSWKVASLRALCAAIVARLACGGQGQGGREQRPRGCPDDDLGLGEAALRLRGCAAGARAPVCTHPPASTHLEHGLAPLVLGGIPQVRPAVQAGKLLECTSGVGLRGGEGGGRARARAAGFAQGRQAASGGGGSSGSICHLRLGQEVVVGVQRHLRARGCGANRERRRQC